MPRNRHETHREALERFCGWGLKTCPDNRHNSSVAGIERYHAQLARHRHELDYEIDGIVVKIDSYSLRRKLGVRAHSPRWAIAWKFEARTGTRIIEDIAVQVGRTGVLTPVALLRPVDVGGVTVSRATLHEAIVEKKSPRLDRFIYALGIRHIGRRTARVLADEFGSLAALSKADVERSENVKNLGDEAATAP